MAFELFWDHKSITGTAQFVLEANGIHRRSTLAAKTTSFRSCVVVFEQANWRPRGRHAASGTLIGSGLGGREGGREGTDDLKWHLPFFVASGARCPEYQCINGTFNTPEAERTQLHCLTVSGKLCMLPNGSESCFSSPRL